MKHPSSLFAAVVSWFLVASAGHSAPLPSAPPAEVGLTSAGLEAMHQLLRDSVQRGEHAGFISVVARDGRIADWQTFGVRDVASGAPMERDTILRIYSMSKIVTSVAILCLIEDGKLQLDDPLAKYLPEFSTPQVFVGGTADAPQLAPAARPITLRQLLAHTSGLHYDILEESPLTELYKRADLWNAPSLAEFVSRAARLPLKSQPGTEFNYSIASDLLGAVVERVSGTDFESFLRTRIFGPLGMPDTSFNVPPEKRPRLAVLSKRDARGKLVPADPIIGAYAEENRGFASGGAGLFSTAADYLRFAQMLCNLGELEGVRILRRETVALLATNQLAGLAKPVHAFHPQRGWGLGVEVEREPAGRVALDPEAPPTFGWCGAATSYVRISPQERTVALLFAQHIPFDEHQMLGRYAQAVRAALAPAAGAGRVTTRPAPTMYDPPTLDVWHGDAFPVGHLGRAQPDVNVLGAVSHSDSLFSLVWSLNGGPPQPLDPSHFRRIAHRGDYNAEIPLTALRPGINEVLIKARWNGAHQIERRILIDRRPDGDQQPPLDIRWSELSDPREVGQIFDGHWQITPDGLRTVTAGYDRVFVIGNDTWRDYEVTGKITIHRLTVVPGRHSARVKHAGFCLRWQSNTPTADQQPGRPRWGLHPRGGITWVTYRNGKYPPLREFYPGESDKHTSFAPIELRENEPFWLKARCVTLPDAPDGSGVTEYSLKAWRQGESETAAWDYTVRQVSAKALRTGGLALVAHEADVTFGDLTIVPIAETVASTPPAN